MRSSCKCARKIIVAAAEVEYKRDRELFIPNALEISWAQDAADGMLLYKYRCVSKTFHVADRMARLVAPTGDRAVECAKDMEAAVDYLCSSPVRVQKEAPDGKKQAFVERRLSDSLKKKFQTSCRNANADGAPVEQLALRLSKACKALPNLDFITRAEEHSCSLVLKNAAEHCDWLQPMLDAWVSGLRRSDSQPGGFARYVHNSHKFKRKLADRFDEAAKAMDRLISLGQSALPPSRKPELSFCMPRFDSFVDPLSKIFRNLKPIFAALVDEEADPSSKSRAWATEMLDTHFSYDSLVSLALATDIWTVGQKWIHTRDQHSRGCFQSICASRRFNKAFLRELDHLIMQENPLAEKNDLSFALRCPRIRFKLSADRVFGLSFPLTAHLIYEPSRTVSCTLPALARL